MSADLDQTLVTFERGLFRALQYVAITQQYDGPLEPLGKAIWQSYDRLIARVADHEMTAMEAEERAFRKALAPLCVTREVFEGFMRARLQGIAPMPGARRLLAWFRDNDVPVQVVTNHGREDAVAELGRARLLPYISDVVAFDEVAPKPDPRIFRQARQLACIRAGHEVELLHIGDSWHSDAAGAVESGAVAGAVWLSGRVAPYHPHVAQVSDLTDLGRVLQALLRSANA